MRYAENGSLGDYITKSFKDLKWKDKIEILYRIISGLNNIHQKQLVHHDFHSGNILHFEWLSQKVMIADLGLSVQTDQEPSSIIGVLPYIAPEVLNEKPYTQKSDIYSFGILMSVISTGQQPFRNLPHDRNLAFKICDGERPAFSINTPDFYIKLAYKCMDADPDNRPTAEEVLKTIAFWKDIEILETNKSNYYYSKKQLDELEKKRENYSKEQLDELEKINEIFDKMDCIKYDPSTIPVTKHPDSVYTSRILKFTNLPQSTNLNKVTIINSNHGN